MSAVALWSALSGDPDHDLDPFPGERLLELAVTTGKAGEGAGAEALETPEDHELESGVNDQRVGEPAAAERLPDPGGRRRRPFDQGGNPFAEQPFTCSIPCRSGPWKRRSRS